MARLPRIDLPGIPQHVVQRGNNRLPCFPDDGDRLRYLPPLADALLATRCQLHAYVLMVTLTPFCGPRFAAADPAVFLR